MRINNSATPASYLILEKEGKILLQRRFNTGYSDGKYTVPSGHVDPGESVIDSIIRETKEEVGIIIKRKDIEFIQILYRKKNNGEQRVDFFFHAKSWEGEPRNMEPEKCDDLGWFDIDNLPENTIDYVRDVVINRSLNFREIGY